MKTTHTPWAEDGSFIEGSKRAVEKLYLLEHPACAAAPDLLAACKAALRIIEMRPLPPQGMLDVEDRLRTVIARAERGEA